MLATLAMSILSLSNPLSDPSVFPIAVWLQEPSLAGRYRAAGFNLYVGLWKGPTDEQLAVLKAAAMPVICELNAVGWAHRKDPTIVGWMHQDEPDNAQPAKTADGKDTWGPCVPPQKIVAEYRAYKANEPTRPVMLNLGQGVANDKWYGRGNGAKLEDYKTYVQGCDIVSFDVYPVAGLHDPAQIPLIAKGIDRLMAWTAGKKRVWNCLECTNIDGRGKATPAQVKAEAWSAIIHGSRGFIYFVHQFQPKFNEHALLDDPEMLKAVTALNRQIQGLAPVINRGKPVEAKVTRSEGRVDVLGLRSGRTVTVIAVSLSDKPSTASIKVAGLPRTTATDVVGEDRAQPVEGGEFGDSFEPYGVHVYRIRLGEATSGANATRPTSRRR